MQGGYNSNSYYHYPPNPSSAPNPNPHPPDHHPYASAPPFSTTSYPPADHSPYASQYPPYPQNQDPIPQSAPPYNHPNPNLHSFTAPPAQPASPFPPYDHQTPYPSPIQQQSHSAPYDQNQTPPDYSNAHLGSSYPLIYETPFERNAKLGPAGSYPDESSGGYSGGVGGYGRSRSDLDGVSRFDSGSFQDDRFGGLGDGVYAYQGNKVDPYGARGTAPKSSTWSGFDDFGRPISSPSEKNQPKPAKIARAVPKADTQQDEKGGVQKFKVKLMAESGAQSAMDVLCQIGLDGIRMLDPSTSRILRIYPLDTVARFQVYDSHTFAFWSKSPVDIEPKRIRLQSNRYTTNTILDIVTAATVQLKEIGGIGKPSDSSKLIEQPSEKKKSLGDWMNLIKPANEEKDHWVPDEAVSKCTGCGNDFSAFVRKHHCRNCGDIFCDKCTQGRIALTAEDNAQPVRVCSRCMVEVTRRLNIAKEAGSKSKLVQSHEDLAKKIQEEMERNRKSTSGSKAEGSGRRMKEVACPICTVHLQVQVPSSGSETIECGVCQHPFLVTAR